MGKRLKQLLENPAVELKHSAEWVLPVHRYAVSFKRVKRAQMDILMKMMLLTFQETEIRRAANLAEMLLVEELFIADLMEKMQRMGLIRMEMGSARLTPKGQTQLNEGIFEEDLEEEQTELIYSPAHDRFWPEAGEAEGDTYRYAEDRAPNEETMLQVLAEREEGRLEDGLQTVVSDIIAAEKKDTAHVLCHEYQLYNQEQDVYYCRVWNTALREWDRVLESEIEEREQLDWRKMAGSH